MQGLITVREVSPSEHEEVGRIVLAAYDGVGQIEGSYRGFMADTGRRVADGSVVWVAEHGGDVRGTVTFTDLEDVHFENVGHGDCGFRLLGVVPEAQGRGVGRALVERCLAEGRARGRRRVAIFSMEWMPGAHRLYASMGFTRRPDRDVMFPAGVGYAFQHDLVPDADAHFPPPGPVPPTPPWYEDVLPR